MIGMVRNIKIILGPFRIIILFISLGNEMDTYSDWLILLYLLKIKKIMNICCYFLNFSIILRKDSDALKEKKK
ncbi:unnamed protein product, partial [Musa banksii]